MTDAQLYLAIGLPSALFALNLLVVIWQARGLERLINTRIDALEKVMAAKFETVDTRLNSLEIQMNARFETSYQQLLRVEGVLDARLKHVEETLNK